MWQSISGFGGKFQVSDDGLVRDMDYKGTGETKQLKPGINHGGYQVVSLIDTEGVARLRYVHQLVAATYVPNPHGLPVVNHINEDKADNRACNLEYTSIAANLSYGTARQRAAAKNSKPVCQIADGIMVAVWPSISAAAKGTGCCAGSIGRCCNGYTDGCGGFDWRFKYDDDMHRRRGGGKREVVQCDGDGQVVARYSSMAEAAKTMGIAAPCISMCCSGRLRTYKGWQWQVVA